MKSPLEKRRLVFGESVEVRAWEDAREMEEKMQEARDAGFHVLDLGTVERLSLKISHLSDCNEPFMQPATVTYPLYKLIHNEDGEPRPGMEKIAEAFEIMETKLAGLQADLDEALTPP